MTIHSFRRVLRVQRMIYTIPWSPGRQIVLPHPIPLRAAAYFGVIASAMFVFSHLPVFGLVALMPWWMRYFVIPLWVGYASTILQVDGREPHRWFASAVGYWLRPHRTIAGRRVAAEGEVRTVRGSFRARWDAYAARAVRGRVRGPAAVVFRDGARFRLGLRGGFIARPGGPVDERIVGDGERLEVRP